MQKMLDVVADREKLARLRTAVRALPFAWSLYRVYWRVRRACESRRRYSDTRSLVRLGDYPAPSLEAPVSQLCTAEQMLTPLYDRWCGEMHSPPRFSRKQWEFVFILQCLSQAGMLADGRRGLGFGCGREPLAGLLAKYGCAVLATDLEREAALEQGWAATMQHTASLEALYECAKEFVARDDFITRVSFRSVDMNSIPPDLDGKFDFVWSACALEHLGSLRHGMDFVRNSLRSLRSGGIAVHTTEFNLSSTDDTLETPSCSVYRASDIIQLITEIEEDGYEVAPLNLNYGDTSVDRHIDLPPYGFSPHLKLMLEDYVVTSIGLIIRKPMAS